MINPNYEITVERSKKQQVGIINLYSLELENIKADDTRTVLSNIMFERDGSEVSNIRLAYHLSKVTDEQAMAEGYRNATSMIMDITGLKKSMISNYRKVATALLMDTKGNFFVPDCIKGYTISQLQEGLEKAGSIRFLEDCQTGNITPNMSAKSIRDYYKEDNEAIDTTAVISDSNGTIGDSVDSGSSDTAQSGNTTKLFLVDQNGNAVGEIKPMNGYTVDGIVVLENLTLEKRVS